jgi:hypothetical protein
VGETVASAEPGSAEMANSNVSGDAGSGGKMHLESLALEAVHVHVLDRQPTKGSTRGR